MLNPSRFRILAIGKVRKTWIQTGLGLYIKRLPGITVTELRDSTPQREAKTILNSLNKNEKIIVLTEEGELLSSRSFAQRLQAFESARLAFVIGGADGLTLSLKDLAHWKLSLSPMTLTHEMARLMLIEQIYRSQSIIQQSPYHRDSQSIK